MREFLTDIAPADFDAFALASTTNHYTKMSAYGRFKRVDGFESFLVGVADEGQLQATALILKKRIPYLFSSYCYVTYGYNMDYTDRELLRFMNIHIVDYVKRVHKACFLRIDPNVCRQQHDKSGALMPEGFNNEWLTAALKEDGFIHLGYNYGYSGNWMSRYTYILDLRPSLEDLRRKIKNYNNHTKKNTLRDIRVTEGNADDVRLLYEAQLELAKKDRFIPKPLRYFQELYESFGDQAHLYIARADLSQAYKNLGQERSQLTEQLTGIVNEKRRATLMGSIDALSREIEMMEEAGYDKQHETFLGAKLIVQVGNKVSNVNMYTHKLLPNFRVAFALHSKAIEASKLRGSETYDFEGISGSTDPHDPYYGLYDFKRSFGGDFIEYLGEFDYIIAKDKYQAFRKIDRFYRRWRRRAYLVAKGW